MDRFLSVVSTDPGNKVRAWYVDKLSRIKDDAQRKERVWTLVQTFDELDKQQQQLVGHWIKCFHMYYALRCRPPPLNIATPVQAALAVLYSPRDRCRLLRKNNIYKMLQSKSEKKWTAKENIWPQTRTWFERDGSTVEHSEKYNSIYTTQWVWWVS